MPAQLDEGSKAQPLPVEGKTIKALTTLHLKRTYDMFAGELGRAPAPAAGDEEGWVVVCV